MRTLPVVFVSSLLLCACASFERAFESEEQESPDQPNAALLWRAERAQDERGQIPPGAWQQALRSSRRRR
jgi:hypothetical protein